MQEYMQKRYPADAEKLRAFMQNLRYCDYAKTRKQLVEACMVAPNIFNNWMCGVTKIPELAKQKINEVIGKQIF